MTFCIQTNLNILSRLIFMRTINRSTSPRFVACSLRNLHLNKTIEKKNKLFSPKATIFEIPTFHKDVRLLSTSLESEQNIDSKKKTLEGGVTVVDINVGNGTIAKSGKTVTVYYSGKLKSTNKVFDELKEGSGLSFRLGRREVIDGWDVGLAGMKVGGKRVITCPPSMAYGAKGYPPVIPPNSTLIFEVELKNVE